MFEITKNQKKWGQASVLIKLGVIIILILLLLIPSAWIEGLITDRESYQQDNIKNVADTWAGDQLIQGPVLAIPYKKEVTQNGDKSRPVTSNVTKMLYLLPQNLQFKAGIHTQSFQNGIYDATVYNSKVMVRGDFDEPDLTGAEIDPASVLYDKARLIFSISDLKGLKNNPIVNIQGQNYTTGPAADDNILPDNGLQVNFPLQKDHGFTFNYQLDLKGSNELNFLDIGRTMNVEVNSDWDHPDFNGRYLPDTRAITAAGFNAKWQMLYYNRPFPQQWTEGDSVLTNKKATANAVFGVKLQVAIDQYRKIMRTVKYSTLIILLTFVSLFLTEMIKKEPVHVFNYTLIGAAMVVYYTLLLSISEQVGYNYAYLLSSVSTISLIAIFTASLLKNKNVALLFALILSIFYGFIFIIIQLEQLSLLFGSVALFVIIATLMYFSRKINWDKH
jgi:inner membrane protein